MADKENQPPSTSNARSRPERHRRYTWTLNNFTEAEETHLKDVATKQLVKYLVFGYEKAPTTGTPHLQGYVELKTALSAMQLRRLLGPRVYAEASRGSAANNRAYCTKSDNYFEHGCINAQGTRNDLLEAIDTLHAGGQNPLKSVAREHPTVFVKFHRGLERLATQLDLIQDRQQRTRVAILYGPPGTGKSRASLDLSRRLSNGDDEIYYKNRGLWWDGYASHTCVIIDDFYGWIKWDELLKICDRYKYMVQYKGGMTKFNSKWIFITSNEHPENWYRFPNYNWAALRRRTDILVDMTPTSTYKFKITYPNTEEELPNEIKTYFDDLL
ncbi:replicase [Cyclovirus sp.]|nr:replicase [Cyclovirus sp.]